MSTRTAPTPTGLWLADVPAATTTPAGFGVYRVVARTLAGLSDQAIDTYVAHHKALAADGYARADIAESAGVTQVADAEVAEARIASAQAVAARLIQVEARMAREARKAPSDRDADQVYRDLRIAHELRRDFAGLSTTLPTT